MNLSSAMLHAVDIQHKFYLLDFVFIEFSVEKSICFCLCLHEFIYDWISDKQSELKKKIRMLNCKQNTKVV